MDQSQMFFESADWYGLLAKECFPRVKLIDLSCPFGIMHLCYSKSQTVVGKLLHSRTWSSLTNFYSHEYAWCESPLKTAKQIESVSIAHAARTLNIDEVFLDYLVADTPSLDSLKEGFVEEGFSIDITHRYVNWRHGVTEETGDEYSGSLSSKLRNTITRNWRKLKREHSPVLIVDDLINLEESIEKYQALYDLSWKASEQYPNFIPALLRLCAAKNILRLGLLSVGSKPIAVQFWIVDAGIAYIYKLAHDPEFTRYSPGTILSNFLAHWVIEQDQVQWIDFGIGDEHYKREWMSSQRSFVSLRALNQETTYGKLLNAERVLRHKLRSVKS